MRGVVEEGVCCDIQGEKGDGWVVAITINQDAEHRVFDEKSMKLE